MILADFLPPKPDNRWKLARQMGVSSSIVKMHPTVTGDDGPWNFEVLERVRDRFADAGFTLAGLEGDPYDMDRIKLGLPGRDEDIERYRKMLSHMGHLNIGLLCYNFMAIIGWFRTRSDIRERGGALVSGFNLRDAAAMEPVVGEPVDEDALWKNYAYFIRAVLPAAEEAGVKMGLHPDDPPVSPLRGVSRIMTSGNALRRALALSDSPSHCITFCQGSLRAAGENIEALAREFGHPGRIAFVHFRDVEGTRDNFRETFHDNGPTDMPSMLRLYSELGLDVPIRVDHVPTLAGEENLEPGYATLGRLHAIGYLRGICETSGIPLK